MPAQSKTPDRINIEREILRLSLPAIAERKLWLPNIASLLAQIEWRQLECSGLNAANYGTDRFLDGSSSGELNVVLHIDAIGPDAEARHPIVVEDLTRFRAAYCDLGLELSDARHIDREDVLDQLCVALKTVNVLPELETSIWQLVRAMHLLEAPEGYDISHSDPEVPFSIFTSLPGVASTSGRLRLAESIVHEAMHLQLSLLEKHIAVIIRADAVAYSPWKLGDRPVQGVFHGLYVFGVIDCFLEAVGTSEENSSDYVTRRRREISAEMREVSSGEIRDDLTEFGKLLYEAICSRFQDT